jgi:hypothetical protein
MSSIHKLTNKDLQLYLSALLVVNDQKYLALATSKMPSNKMPLDKGK